MTCILIYHYSPITFASWSFPFVIISRSCSSNIKFHQEKMERWIDMFHWIRWDWQGSNPQQWYYLWILKAPHIFFGDFWRFVTHIVVHIYVIIIVITCYCNNYFMCSVLCISSAWMWAVQAETFFLFFIFLQKVHPNHLKEAFFMSLHTV